jgi:tetratricopeptide (TPR) repeat protein
MGSKKKDKQTQTNRVNKNSLIVYLLFLVLVPLVLYFRVVNFQFTNLDDENIILEHYDTIGDINKIKEAFNLDAFMSKKGYLFYRPVQTISFMLDAQLGGKEPWVYHLSNLVIHILTVIALFFFLKKIRVKDEISFLLLLFFSIHPLFANAVAWIPARGDLLLGLFTLLSLITFLEYFESRKIIYFILHASVFMIAIFSKETAVLLPVVILFYLYFAAREKFIIKDVIPFLTVWGIIFVLYYYLRQNVLRGKGNPGFFGLVPFIKNLPVIPITFGKFFLPQNLSAWPLFDSASLIIGIILLLISVALVIKYKDGNWRIIVWGAIWFLSFTVPAMIFRTYMAEVGIEYNEYRTYLPMMGILVIMGVLGSKLLNKFSFNAILKVSIPVILIYAIIAFTHSAVFADSISFYTSAINGNSRNAIAFNSRGNEYYNSGNVQQAMADYESAIEIFPSYSAPIFNKGVVYHSAGDDIKAEYLYSQALKFDTLSPVLTSLRFSILYNFAGEKMILKKYDEAIVLLKKAEKESPEISELYNNLGYAYFSTGRKDSALYAYSKAIELKPISTLYYTNRGTTKYSIKDFVGALSDYNRALELDHNSAISWYNTGNTKIELNDFEGAISDLNTAIKMNPEWGDAYYHRGIAFSRLNKQPEAREDWAEARRLGLKEPVGEKQKEK